MNIVGNLTATRFEDICWRQLLVRILVETIPKNVPLIFMPAREETTICLFSLVRDVDENEFFTGLMYHDVDPTDTQKNCSELRGLISLLSENQGDRHDTIDGILNDWDNNRPPLWSLNKPLIACRRVGTEIQEIKPWDIRLLQHYARLETRLAYEMTTDVHSPWELSGIFHRVGGLIREQSKVWKPILD